MANILVKRYEVKDSEIVIYGIDLSVMNANSFLMGNVAETYFTFDLTKSWHVNLLTDKIFAKPAYKDCKNYMECFELAVENKIPMFISDFYYHYQDGTDKDQSHQTPSKKNNK